MKLSLTRAPNMTEYTGYIHHVSCLQVRIDILKDMMMQGYVMMNCAHKPKNNIFLPEKETFANAI